ncbi:MAG: phosphoribosylglycinamide formyltransferase-1 [Patiriisocius sp.]|jgi:phosphoribosylglycinamide formyltransferase-1
MNRKIVILASGGGSNARSIIEYFQKKNLDIAGIITNNIEAGVHGVAKENDIPSYFFNKEDRVSGKMLNIIKDLNPDLVVLAGYLLKIPKAMIECFPERIVNIHPALLPKFGGKGMYGMHVHHAVIASNETESGLTIHFVNENYDEGHIIKQVSCKVVADDDAGSLQKKILKLEHTHYPIAIEELLKSMQ